MPSKFPAEIDVFTKHYDPTSDLMPKIAEYENLRSKVNKTEEEILRYAELGKELAPYIFTTEELNMMQDSMVNIQSFFKNGVEGYVNTEKQEINNTVQTAKSDIDNKATASMQDITAAKDDVIQTKNDFSTYVDGKVDYINLKADSFSFINEFQEGATYQINNIVRYQNALYILIADNPQKVPPSDSSKWKLMMPFQKGDQGIQGVQGKQGDQGLKGDKGDSFNYRGLYNKQSEYKKNDVVTCENSLYILIVDWAKDKYPPTYSDNWSLMMPNQKGERGPQGDPGTPGMNLLYKGVWKAKEFYKKEDMVSYGFKLYACLENHSATETFDNTKWQVIMESDNINLEQLAIRLKGFYRSNTNTVGNTTTIDEKVVQSVGADIYDESLDGSVLISCKTTVVENSGDKEITQEYTDPMMFLGSSSLIVKTNVRGNQIITRRV